ncbi:DUF6319 family protein [Umezawaea sp. Da 62-37]|uniref:DUF6319 family protein n=1 Tax=Umezawaea sp. Da 62-37 TaxID=3075927 RepID=UPI0028F6E023|nr:DUF6319 family protein [Umezawaea sp. Da 62-37]WNV83802.1 DUF6319 family protein [Umezawaea sp. Da 62-37]
MAQGSLSPQDLDHLRAELAEGRQPAVWFTSAAVGVEAGRSAKVISFTEPEEGDFIQVRPTGDRDEISFSPAELTTEKPARKKAPAPKPPVKEEEEPPKPVEIEHVYTPAPPPVVEKPKPAPVKAAPVARKGAKPAEVTITLTSTIEGEWAAEVLVGVKRTLRQATLTPSAVAQAAKLLHPEVAAAVDAVLNAARETHLARVEQLRAELEVAQRALDELSG